MNSKDYRNLQEAYIGVYDDDIREKLEFESWVNNLLEEGYDLSDYTWEEMYENYIQLDEISDRRVEKTLKARERRFNNSIDSGAPNKEFHQLRKTEKLVASRNKRTGSNIKVDENHQLDEISQKTATRAFAQRATNEFETDQTSKKSDATKSRIEKKFGKKAGAHAERAAHANIFGRKSSSMPKESYDLYDIILSHLLDEGYADTQEAAERIMVNMSEDWRESIVEQGLDPDAPGNTHSLADLHNALKKYEDKKNAAKSPKPGGSGSAGKVKENNK